MLRGDYMDNNLFNAIYGYIEVLYSSNRRLIKLCGSDAIDTFNVGCIEILDLLQDIPRLIPYGVERGVKVKLNNQDGLLEFDDNLRYLKDNYESIIQENKELLIKIKKIRNKYEHKIHDAKIMSHYSGNDSWFRFGFKVNDKKYDKEKKDYYPVTYEYYIDSKDLIKLVKQLNILFNKILKDITNYAYVNKIEHPFFEKISRISFLNFNKIYESDILYEVGKTLNDI